MRRQDSSTKASKLGGTPLSGTTSAGISFDMKLEVRVVQLKTSLCHLPRFDLMANILAFLTAFAAMASGTANQTDDHQPQAATIFCWKATQTRGVGRVPESCAAGEERLGLLCYDKCPVGTARVGLDCHSICPAGFADHGLFCRYSEYGRGVGYPWKFGDWLNDSGMYERCEKEEGQDKCETSGVIVYPKCDPGYTAFGCCLCRPEVPNCTALGLGGGLDLSCAKKITIGTPKLGTCAANEDLDAGLCYPKCKPSYTGVGPVCWGLPPPSWVQCGMGAAKSSALCSIAIKDQVVSALVLAFNIATRFTSSSAKVLQAPANAAQVSQVSKAWNMIAPLVKAPQFKAGTTWAKITTGKNVYSAVNGFSSSSVIAYYSQNATFTVEDYVRTSAAILSVFEPSGIASVVAAYTYPTCDKVEAISANKHG
ncbi:hypothetical protein B5M09_012237 [Aphanomyces astaci]|uniref:Uncharacterized protein n=1 Tax=Aphanomyces astaci TaxID=112090 RepID=A0A425D9B6_APHAT|nr:hypothetical protein B5M09_012237 [Aphanomyces astaci]